jgi:hypothetical protein
LSFFLPFFSYGLSSFILAFYRDHYESGQIHAGSLGIYAEPEGKMGNGEIQLSILIRPLP